MRTRAGAVSKVVGFDGPKKGCFVSQGDIGRKVDMDF
jgi:hypothetical protein